jgi:autotransporter-associated beta strand protein
LSNPVLVGGNTTIAGSGALRFEAGAWTITGGNRTLTVNNSGRTTIASAIGEDSPGRSLTKTGPGMIILAGNNTFTGDFIASDGMVLLSSIGALGGVTRTVRLERGAVMTLMSEGDKINDAARMVLHGGVLSGNSFSETMGRLSLEADSTLRLAPGRRNRARSRLLERGLRRGQPHHRELGRHA